MKRSSRTAVAVLALVVTCPFLSACSDGGEQEQAALSDPASAVTTWLAAVSDLDLIALDEVTAAPNVALMAAAENAFSTSQLAAVVDSGLPDPTAQSYWGTFRDGMVTFLGVTPDTLVVGDVEEFTHAGIRFAVVTIGSGESTTGVVARRTAEGWVVDLVATAGPALAVQVRRLLEDLSDAGDEDVAAAYATIVVESLGAALDREPDNRALELEVEAIEDLHLHD